MLDEAEGKIEELDNEAAQDRKKRWEDAERKWEEK